MIIVSMKLIILCVLFSSSWAAPAAHSMTFHDDGSYKFYYETGEEGGSHSRSEVRHADGSVVGKFSYQDPDGEMREVNYKANEDGFVAQGDVGVKGAPKGQFPAIPEEHVQKQSPSTTATTEPTIEPTTEPTTESTTEPTGNEPSQTEVTSYQAESRHAQEDGDELQDLDLEESADYPPEGFPQGFFLQNFHGLRRLPEPTKEPQTMTEPPKEIHPEEEAPAITEVKMESSKEASTFGEIATAEVKQGHTADIPLNPFWSHAPQEWGTMFHQPVYVFSYNQPDAYGYHYFF